MADNFLANWPCLLAWTESTCFLLIKLPKPLDHLPPPPKPTPEFSSLTIIIQNQCKYRQVLIPLWVKFILQKGENFEEPKNFCPEKTTPFCLYREKERRLKRNGRVATLPCQIRSITVWWIWLCCESNP